MKLELGLEIYSHRIQFHRRIDSGLLRDLYDILWDFNICVEEDVQLHAQGLR